MMVSSAAGRRTSNWLQLATTNPNQNSSLVSARDYCEGLCTHRVPKVSAKKCHFPPPPPCPRNENLEVSSQVGLQNSKCHFIPPPPKEMKIWKFQVKSGFRVPSATLVAPPPPPPPPPKAKMAIFSQICKGTVHCLEKTWKCVTCHLFGTRFLWLRRRLPIIQHNTNVHTEEASILTINTKWTINAILCWQQNLYLQNYPKIIC